MEEGMLYEIKRQTKTVKVKANTSIDCDRETLGLVQVKNANFIRQDELVLTKSVYVCKTSLLVLGYHSGKINILNKVNKKILISHLLKDGA